MGPSQWTTILSKNRCPVDGTPAHRRRERSMTIQVGPSYRIIIRTQNGRLLTPPVALVRARGFGSISTPCILHHDQSGVGTSWFDSDVAWIAVLGCRVHRVEEGHAINAGISRTCGDKFCQGSGRRCCKSPRSSTCSCIKLVFQNLFCFQRFNPD